MGAGTTTTCESLYMGVPCVTLAGHCHAHNVGVTLLSSLGLADTWVAHSQAQYVALAADWASHARAADLAALGQGLRQRMLASPLCDAPRFVGHLEAAYARAYADWRSGARPPPRLGLPQ